MIDWVLFNLLIFNYDAHGKNVSFFVGSKGISLAPFYDLVNIKMYPEFEHEMAMALGEEFDGNAINAYQLADFANDCQLPRRLLTKRLKYLIKKLMFIIDNEIKTAVINDDERSYLEKYRIIVYERCEHLLQEADKIVSIRL